MTVATNQQLDKLWLRANRAWEQGERQEAADLFYQAVSEHSGGADFYLALYSLSNDPEYLVLAAEQRDSIGQQSSLVPAEEPVWYRPSLSQGQIVSTPGDLLRARDLWQGEASEELDEYDHEVLNDLTRATLALYDDQYRQVLAITERLDIPGFRSDIDFLLGAALIASDLAEVGVEFIDRAQSMGLSPEAQELADRLLVAADDPEAVDFPKLFAADRRRQAFSRVVGGFYSSASSADNE
jgi:hypothetical protein